MVEPWARVKTIKEVRYEVYCTEHGYLGRFDSRTAAEDKRWSHNESRHPKVEDV